MFDIQCVCMVRAMLLGLFVNPWHTYTLRVTVLGSVCLLSHISPMEHVFILKTLSSTQRATKIKKFVGFCLKRLCSRVMPQNTSEEANFQFTCGQLSPIDKQRSARGCQMIVNNIQPCPKRCLLMLLAHFGVKNDSMANFRARALASYAR